MHQIHRVSRIQTVEVIQKKLFVLLWDYRSENEELQEQAVLTEV
jgi:hypothetical protein